MKDRPSLTAHLCATAVVAACRSYRADPILALSGAPNRGARRGLPPAIDAICEATGATMYRVCKCLNFPTSSVSTARRRAGAPYHLAVTAALGAIGGARLVLAPSAPTRERRPDPETVSGKPDRLLEPNPHPVIDLGRAAVVKNLPALPAPVATPQAPLGSASTPFPPQPRVAPRSNAGAAPKVFGRLDAAPPPSMPTTPRESVSDSDRALIEAAIAKGKVRQVDKADGTELVWDPDHHTYARFPRSELEFVPGYGWKRSPGCRGRSGSAATSRRRALAKTAQGASS